MFNIIAAVGTFVSFISKPIGAAFAKGLETIVGKAVEYKMDKYLDSVDEKKVSDANVHNNIIISNNIITNYVSPNGLYNQILDIDKVMVLLHDCSKNKEISTMIQNELSKNQDIIFFNKEVENIDYSNYDNAIIDVYLNGKRKLQCDFVTRNLIPGIKDVATLSLKFHKPVGSSKSIFAKEVTDGICAVIYLLKNLSPFCCNTIRSHMERLQLEAELLYKQGYKNISFKELLEQKGYIIELTILGQSYIFFLSYEYPLVAPEIWLYAGEDSYPISFANNCWKKEYTISQIVSAIERGYNGRGY